MSAGINRNILKGQLGHFSKIIEEFHELVEAKEMRLKVHVLIELSDLIGAIDHYLAMHFSDITIQDLLDEANAKGAYFDDLRSKND